MSAAYVSRPASGSPIVAACEWFEGAATADNLERIGKELHAARYQCSTLLGAREYQLLSVEAPNVPPDELRTAIRWRLKDMLDFHVDDATIDVLDVPVEPNAPSRTHNMFAVAARNSVVRKRMQLFGDARIDVTVIDIPDMAQRNIAALVEPEGRGLAMLSFTDEGGLLTVTYRGELYLSRRIDVPVAQLVEGDYERRSAVFDRVTLELQRSLDHFDRQYHYINVAKLVLAPFNADGLAAYLTSNLYVPVETLDLASTLDIASAPLLADPAMQQKFFLTLGAALRYEEVKL
ncbi:type IV pilus biogenesis protein PilM [Pseudoduganella sp. GCM10020061]|uniref:type IV pilus biogenesis protein PilM n=1 Tax=Pseudoduganella sp. GCM10020061 TaxID=3317345 RepID=UPI00363C6853